MNWWFVSWIIISLFSLGYEAAKHGEAKNSKYNGWASLISELIWAGWLILMGVRL